MKTKALILICALGVTPCLVTAQGSTQTPSRPGPPPRGNVNQPAAPGGQGQRPDGPGGVNHQRPPMPIIEVLDVNKNGTIDAVEIANASALLKKLDLNKDGKLTPDEYHPPHPGGPNGPGGPADQGRSGSHGPGGQTSEPVPQRPALDSSN